MEKFEGLLQKKFCWATEQVKREMDEFEKSCAC